MRTVTAAARVMFIGAIHDARMIDDGVTTRTHRSVERMVDRWN